MYDPLIGRWTSPDPVGRIWWNRISYLIESPMLGCDPTGLEQGTEATLEGAKARAKQYAEWADAHPENAWLPCAKHVSAEVVNLVEWLQLAVSKRDIIKGAVYWEAFWFASLTGNTLFAHAAAMAASGGADDEIDKAEALSKWLLGFGAELFSQAQNGIPFVLTGESDGYVSSEWSSAAEVCSGCKVGVMPKPPFVGPWKLDKPQNAGSLGHTKACCDAMVDAEQAPGTAWIDSGNAFPGLPGWDWLTKQIGEFTQSEYLGEKADPDSLGGSHVDRIKYAKKFCCKQAALDKAAKSRSVK